MVSRVGWAELDKPGRRVEAIRAVERRLAAEPADPAAQELRTPLYAGLTEPEFVTAAAGGAVADVDYAYVEQLGYALADDPDPARRDRGAGYLRVAGRGAPERGPGAFRKLAAVADKFGDAATARGYLEQAKKCGQTVGPSNLARDQRDFYFGALQKLAADADALGDTEAAIADLRLYLEGGGRAEQETYRKLAELYAKQGDPMNALLMTETGLTYSGTDADLLAKKDSYYYSVTVEKLTAVRDRVGKWFDVPYCISKAMGVLNGQSDDPAMLDWAAHLAALARVLNPDAAGVKLVEARLLLRRERRDDGIRLLEDIRVGPKGRGDDQDAWYAATKILGGLYLDELNQPAMALKAFQDYKEYTKSGADTLYQMARAYEAMGDTPNAVRFYEAVTAYEEHPRYWDAKAAVTRLRAGPAV